MKTGFIGLGNVGARLANTLHRNNKDIGLFQDMADTAGVTLELNPLLIKIFEDGAARYGSRANSPSIIERLESQCGVRAVADGFPESIEDDEPEERGREIVPGPG